MAIQGAHLVGSLTCTDAESTFRVASQHLGGHLRRIPDGEVGPRFHWILFQGAAFAATAGLSRVGDEPALLAGFDVRPFALDGSVEPDRLAFSDLGYADAALESYATFARLREAGVVRAGTRFQVSLPTPLAALTTFVHPEARAAVEGPYTAALLAELDRITAAIPAADLAIQFDLAVEFAYLENSQGRAVAYGRGPWWDDVAAGLLDRAAHVGRAVPAGVELGFHLCYGDVGERHFVEPLDATNLVLVANGLAERIDREITWLHLPVPIERDDAAFFAPLRDLHRHRFAELYLGLVHHEDGTDGARARIASAGASGVGDFGLATECGFGRGPAERTAPLLDLHARLAAAW
ncbi:hypothetical protein GCG21_10005 [Pseudactinotalea sp. HY160]|uniref:hypothetical protein n=1 Tax=Pseudactinotalea sp. HY160 TaxID=2654490 RepID=UPI00128D6737|nr:hypothetical protein [Pseudactinotalea sp. HY160]MPV50329.1 hypothetical protein [Pseudactinotalea sp. HY160]